MGTGRASPSLVLAGRLEFAGLPEILQILAASRREGVLSVEREDPPERAEIELVRGRVTGVRVSGPQEPVGELLQRLSHLDPEQLAAALDAQSAMTPRPPLGTLLLEMGAVQPGDLAGALAEQIEAAVAALLEWDSGLFRFHTRVPGAGRRAGAGQELGVALEPNELLMSAAQRRDEAAGRSGGGGEATFH
jgi:hypothetical protein